MAAVIGGTFPAPHVRVLDGNFRPAVDSSAVDKLRAASRAVVGQEHQNGVIGELLFGEEFLQAAHIPIEVRHHSLKTGQLIIQSLITKRLLPLVSHKQRPMRSVRRQIDEERLTAAGIRRDRRHELHRFVEPDVCTVAFEFRLPVSDKISVIEIVVRPVI